MTQALYEKYRPKLLKEIRGQEQAKKLLQGFIKRHSIPHAIMLVGPTGTGKTSIAHILARKLKCHENDCIELNAAMERGIDTIREIEGQSGLTPSAGESRVWIMDEAHALTRDAQTSMLKLLENDRTDWVFYILCTTDPEKLLPTIRSRCTLIRMDALDGDMLSEILNDIVLKEGVQGLDRKVLKQIIEAADGSARTAVNLLESVMHMTDAKEQLECIVRQSPKAQAIEIARHIISPSPTWKSMAKILRGVEEDPEKLRHMILSYVSKVMLSGVDNPKFQKILIQFEGNFYDTKMSGLIRACYECCK